MLGSAPETSISALKLCRLLGVDVIEVDLHVTKDGKVVVMRDDTFGRATSLTGRLDEHTLAYFETAHIPDNKRILIFEDVTTWEWAALTKNASMLNPVK